MQLSRDSWNQTQWVVSWVFANSGWASAHRGLWMCRSLRGPGRGIMLGSSKFSYWLASQVVPLQCVACCCSVPQLCLTLFDPMVCRPFCPSPSPKVCPSSCPLHQWCHPAISSSDTLFFCPQSFPAYTISNLKFSLTLTILKIYILLWPHLKLYHLCMGDVICDGICPLYTLFWASLVAQLVKNLPAVQETVFQFLGGEDTLENG